MKKPTETQRTAHSRLAAYVLNVQEYGVCQRHDNLVGMAAGAASLVDKATELAGMARDRAMRYAWEQEAVHWAEMRDSIPTVRTLPEGACQNCGRVGIRIARHHMGQWYCQCCWPKDF